MAHGRPGRACSRRRLLPLSWIQPVHGVQKELEEEEAVLDMDDGVSDTKDGSRMLRDEVTPDDIASVVASWTGDCIGPVIYQNVP